MLRLYYYFSGRIKVYVQKPKSSVRILCYIPSYKLKIKCYMCILLLVLMKKKRLDLTTEKFQPHKSAKLET